MGDGREADQSSDVHNLGLNLFTIRPAKDGKVLISWYARHQIETLHCKIETLHAKIKKQNATTGAGRTMAVS